MKQVQIENKMMGALITDNKNADEIPKSIIVSSKNRKILSYVKRNKKIKIGELSEILGDKGEDHLRKLLDLDILHKPKHYLDVLKRREEMKNVKIMSNELVEAYEKQDMEKMAEIELQLSEYTAGTNNTRELKKMKDIMQGYIDDYDKKAKNFGCGIKPLDRIWKAEPTDLVIVAARPSIGGVSPI